MHGYTPRGFSAGSRNFSIFAAIVSLTSDATVGYAAPPEKHRTVPPGFPVNAKLTGARLKDLRLTTLENTADRSSLPFKLPGHSALSFTVFHTCD